MVCKMKVLTSPQAARFVHEHGGRLFVWPSRSVCCGGTRFILASTKPPADLVAFHHVSAQDFELYVRPGAGQLPNEFHIDIKGKRRRRVEAYWNGCACLV